MELCTVSGGVHLQPIGGGGLRQRDVLCNDGAVRMFSGAGSSVLLVKLEPIQCSEISGVRGSGGHSSCV